MAAKHFAREVSQDWFEDDPLADVPLRFGRHFKEPEPASISLETFEAQADTPDDAVHQYIEQLTAELEYHSRHSAAKGKHEAETLDIDMVADDASAEVDGVEAESCEVEARDFASAEVGEAEPFVEEDESALLSVPSVEEEADLASELEPEVVVESGEDASGGHGFWEESADNEPVQEGMADDEGYVEEPSVPDPSIEFDLLDEPPADVLPVQTAQQPQPPILEDLDLSFELTDDLEATLEFPSLDIHQERLAEQPQEERLRVSTNLPESEVPIVTETALDKHRPFGFFARIGEFISRVLHLDDR